MHETLIQAIEEKADFNHPPSEGPGSDILFREVTLMTRKNGVKDGNTLRVLVADSTLLTGSLIADALRRDRKLSVTNTTSNSVLSAASTLHPHVTVLSESQQGIPGRGFAVLRELRARSSGQGGHATGSALNVRWWWNPSAEAHEEYFVEATRSAC